MVPQQKQSITLSRIFVACAALSTLTCLGWPSHAQAPGSSEGRADDRRPQWTIPDDATSDNNRILQRILERSPDADTDKDGKLSAAEARAYIDKQRDRWRERGDWRRTRIEPTFDNVKYGPNDKHHFDLYQARTDTPTALLLFFHGGQFITGNESSLGTLDLRALLDAGISVASIDYREANEAPFPGPFDDAARALQFIRFYAEQLNIDPTRIAGHGEEAGGNLALYLALHDDLRDDNIARQIADGTLDDPRKTLPPGPIQPPDRTTATQKQTDAQTTPPTQDSGTDPAPSNQSVNEAEELSDVAQQSSQEDESASGSESFDSVVLAELIPWDSRAIESASTRLAAAVARHPIATFDPRAWEKHGLPMNDHERLMTKYLDVRYLEPLNDPAVIAVVERVSPLALVSAGDPPLLLLSQYADMPVNEKTVWTIMRHHPMQSQLISRAMRGKGNEATVRYKGMSNDPGISSVEFIKNHLR